MKTSKIQFYVILVIVFLCSFLVIKPLNLRPVYHEPIYGTAVKEAVEETTGESYSVVESWVKENMHLEEYCMNFQDVNLPPISTVELGGNALIMHYIHSDSWKEDCTAQQTGHRLKFLFKFAKLPAFMEKGFLGVNESSVGNSINDILHFLPIEPVKLSVKSTETGEIADIRYLACYLDSINEDKTEFTIVTEPFALCDNPAYAGRVAGINRIYFPQEEKGFVMEIGGTYFERVHK